MWPDPPTFAPAAEAMPGRSLHRALGGGDDHPVDPQAPAMNRYPQSACRVRRTVAAVVLALCAGVSQAQEADAWSGGLRVSGFGSIGLAHVDAPAGWAYKRGAAQADNRAGTRADLDTRLGLQLNNAPTRTLELLAQVVAARRGPAALDADTIEWAFLTWRPDPEWKLQAGRVNFDAFLLSDHRHVGIAYPFVRPPVDFHAQLPRSLDGADLARGWNVDGAHWRAKVFAGRAAAFADASARLDLSPSYGATVSREADGLLLRASAVRTRLEQDIDRLRPLLDALAPLAALPVPSVAEQAASLRSRLALSGVSLTYLALGARLERGPRLVSGEFTRVTGQPTVAHRSAYASIGRRFGALTVYALASRVEAINPAVTVPDSAGALAPLLGPAVASQAQGVADAAVGAVNAFRLAQGTTTFGLRHDLDARWALKPQWDRIRVSRRARSGRGRVRAAACRPLAAGGGQPHQPDGERRHVAPARAGGRGRQRRVRGCRASARGRLRPRAARRAPRPSADRGAHRQLAAGDPERCLAAGMDGFLGKPYTLAALQATLRRWLPEAVAKAGDGGSAQSQGRSADPMP